MTVGATAVGAQQQPPIRQITRVERVTTDSLASVAAAVPMPGGRVLLNDIASRRVVLLDSMLSHPIVVADTSSITSDAYGAQDGTLIRYRGDSALFISPSSLSMLVITPAGAIARVMAIPRPDDAVLLLDVFGTPGFDSRGRLAYYGAAANAGTLTFAATGRPVAPGARQRIEARPQAPDSAFIVRVDLTSRTVDTAAWFKIPPQKVHVNFDEQDIIRSITVVNDPVPIVDDWTVLPDGSIALLRGRDYHIDWIGTDGSRTSSPKMPFDWQPLSDDRKTALIDSAVIADQARWDGPHASSAPATSTTASRSAPSGGRGSSAAAGGRGGAAAAGLRPVPYVFGRAALQELPDYFPAFKQAALHADAEGNLWIRTSTVVDDRPVYDIVDHHGTLIDRAQLPAFRTIAGFGPGVLYMAVKDASGVIHLERARIH
ncbi:MAG TPA: hypothetical protein VGM67_01470 [Gemmatimonadaceae bacterium]